MYGKNEPEDKSLSNESKHGIFWIVIPLMIAGLILFISENPHLFS